MKVALAQLNYRIGDFEFNSRVIIENIEKARSAGAEVVVFAELAICGYPPLDFLDYAYFIDRAEKAISEIAVHCLDITAIIGAPVKNEDPKGKNLFNAAVVISNGKIIQTVSKTLLPTYDVFDEYRWFESNRNFSCVDVNGVRIAITVCEDLWNFDDDPLYTFWPMKELILQEPVLMINIAASPFSVKHADERRKILEKNVREFRLPLLYVNQVGGHADILFDGGSLAFHSDGQLASQMATFTEDFCVYDIDTGSGKIRNAELVASKRRDDDEIAMLHKALVMGISDYFSKMGFSKAVLGLSGGIDSAVVLALACEALGKDNVHAVLMPSSFSSEHSVSDSLEMISKVGCTHELIPISNLYDLFLDSLESSFGDSTFSIAEENIQARIRGVLLMAISNKLGYILLNTSNKSELAVGYGTLYGDMCGGLSVIGDCYKTTVYALANRINAVGEKIPASIINKAPSAELRPGQYDSDSLPPYEILDSILQSYIEHQNGPERIVKDGFDPQLVNRILKMVNSNEWKRHQFAPILRVTAKAFGRGRRMPLVAKYS